MTPCLTLPLKPASRPFDPDALLSTKLLARLGTGAADEKTTAVRDALVELKLELRSLYSSLDAISGNEISANQLRSMEGIRHLLAGFAERTRVLEEEIGDPAALAPDIVAGNVAARVSIVQ